jgi:CPA2 family monovalent cation:H+ antiporter-2
MPGNRRNRREPGASRVAGRRLAQGNVGPAIREVSMTDTGLLVTLALALIAATIGAAVAVRLGQSAILGYVVAGVLIGPYTIGPVANPTAVAELADIGLVFLLFAIGLELSIGDLARVGRVAVLGGSVQVVAMVGIGYVVGVGLGFGPLESLFFGAFISQSSSMVMAKILAERGELDSSHGHLVLGWATLQDLSTVVLVVVLSGLALGGDLVANIGLALGKAALFVAILLPVGLKVLPWVLEQVARLRSREVFVLSVVAVALGMAYLSEFFGLSLALGAFLAGLLVSESDISHHILGELAPLRDVFAGLFFVSVGMLVDPGFVVSSFGLVVIAVLLVVAVKGGLIAGLSRVLGVPGRTGILAGIALATAGEFSFLLARLGVDTGAVGDQMFSLMLASAGVSIALAPSLTKVAPGVVRGWDLRFGAGRARPGEAEASAERMGGRYTVLCGYGRVGRMVAEALERRGFPYVVIEVDARICRSLRGRGITVVQGPAESAHIRERANLGQAQALIITVPDPFALQQVVHHTRAEYPRLPIIARARTAAEREFLQREGVSEIVVAETEVALEMARYTLARLGVSAAETQAIVTGLRRRATG